MIFGKCRKTVTPFIFPQMSSRRNRAVMDVPQNSVSHQSSLLFFTAKNDLPVDTHQHLASVWCGRKVYDEMKWFVGSDQNS